MALIVKAMSVEFFPFPPETWKTGSRANSRAPEIHSEFRLSEKSPKTDLTVEFPKVST